MEDNDISVGCDGQRRNADVVAHDRFFEPAYRVVGDVRGRGHAPTALVGEFFRIDYVRQVGVVVTAFAYPDVPFSAAFPEFGCHAQFALVVKTAVPVLHFVPLAVEERQQDVPVILYVFQYPLFLVGA